MSRGTPLVALVVFLSTCSTCVGAMKWQSRRIEVKDSLPEVFYVLVQTAEGPKAINLSREHREVQAGSYALPKGAAAIVDSPRIKAAAATRSRPDVGIVLRLEFFNPGPPPRLSMMFNYNDYGYRTEYQVADDGRVHPIASRSLVKRMGVIAAFWSMVVAFVSWAAAVQARLCFARRLGVASSGEAPRTSSR